MAQQTVHDTTPWKDEAKLQYFTGFGNEFASCHPDFPDALPQGQVSLQKEPS